MPTFLNVLTIFVFHCGVVVLTTCLFQEHLPFLLQQTKRLSVFRLQHYPISPATHKLSPMC